MNTEKVLYCLYEIILKIRANLKCHNRVYILSSKHCYRPMRARVVAQLFYNCKFVNVVNAVMIINADLTINMVYF